MKRVHTHGFTLLELSIALVIIGLITGGVLVGRDLIRASEIRATISQKEKFDAATNAFRGKYNCLPGDCATGTNFGFANNGNGDKQVGMADDYISNYNGINKGFIYPEEWTEMGDYWVQLSAANLIDGQYTLASPDPTFPAVGTVSPKSKMGNSYWWLMSNQVIFINNTIVDLWVTKPTLGRHIFWITGTLYNSPGAATLTPIDAFAIDSKMDDGKPFSGNVMASDNSGGIHGGPTQTQVPLWGLEYMAGPAGSGKCVNNSVTPPVYNMNADTNTDCANDLANCHLCGLVMGASF